MPSKPKQPRKRKQTKQTPIQSKPPKIPLFDRKLPSMPPPDKLPSMSDELKAFREISPPIPSFEVAENFKNAVTKLTFNAKKLDRLRDMLYEVDGRTTATRFEVVESEVRRLVPLVDDGIEEAQKWRQKACVMRERGVGCALDTDCLKESDVVARWMERLLDDEEEEFVRLSLNQVKLE